MDANTNTASTLSLKQVLIHEAQTLKGMCITRRNLVRKIAQQYGFEKGYVRVMVRKCTVNDICRARWGKSANLFALTETNLLVSNSQYVKGFPVVDDQELRASLKSRRDAKKATLTAQA